MYSYVSEHQMYWLDNYFWQISIDIREVHLSLRYRRHTGLISGWHSTIFGFYQRLAVTHVMDRS
jgi:hypothetical protein